MVLKTLRTQQKMQSRWLTWMVSVPQPLDGNVLRALCVPQTGSWLFLWCRFFKAPFEALGMQRAEHFCSVNQVREREQDALKNKNIQGNMLAGWVLPCCQEFHVQTSPAVPVIIILIFFFFGLLGTVTINGNGGEELLKSTLNLPSLFPFLHLPKSRIWSCPHPAAEFCSAGIKMHKRQYLPVICFIFKPFTCSCSPVLVAL